MPFCDGAALPGPAAWVYRAVRDPLPVLMPDRSAHRTHQTVSTHSHWFTLADADDEQTRLVAGSPTCASGRCRVTHSLCSLNGTRAACPNTCLSAHHRTSQPSRNLDEFDGDIEVRCWMVCGRRQPRPPS